jgi:precorrin-3B synthase
MSTLTRGWCPSLYEPMESGDGLLVRVKPSAGTLSAIQAHRLADAATRFGSGVIELTNRANLQIRGLSESSVPAFAALVAAQGLASGDPAAEQRRNVIVSPLYGCDPGVTEATLAVALSLERMLADDITLAGLPGKFGVTVDSGGALPVARAPGDILLQLRGDEVLVSLDGDAAACAVTDGVAAVRRLIQAFLDLGPARRMRDLPASRVFATAGLTPDCKAWDSAPGRSVGMLPGAFGVGLSFGQMGATALHALADCADNYGNGTLRLTPWRSMVLPGPHTAPDLPDGLITDPDDPALSISACAGQPACPRATVAARRDAAWLARAGVATGRVIHVSGCAKGCAHPRPATVTLVGADGAYGVVWGGKADAVPSVCGLSIAEIADLLRTGTAS